MEESTDNKFLGLWRGAIAIPFIKKLFAGSRLVMRVVPYNEGPIEMVFNITGAEAAVGPLRKACRW
jgi:type VI secretion system protein VasI